MIKNLVQFGLVLCYILKTVIHRINYFMCVSCRSDHLYAFFVQWTPDVYGEGLSGVTREPGFVVVKKNQDAESGEHDKPVPDITFKDWEV